MRGYFKNYGYSGGIQDWMEACKFETSEAAIMALGCGKRSFFRWKSGKLPKGFVGRLISRRMSEIEVVRKRELRKS